MPTSRVVDRTGLRRRLRGRLRALAAGQHGIVAGHQLRSFAPAPMIRWELGRPEWEAVATSVHRLEGHPETVESQAMAAVLAAGPGALLSHHSALAAWGVQGPRLLPAHVLRMRGANGVRPTLPVVLHESRRCPEAHVTVHHGFPITTPSRALVDVAAFEHPGRLERWMDQLWTLRLVDHRSLSEAVAVLARRGRSGPPVVKALLADRSPDHTPAASGLESRLDQVLRSAGIGRVSRQVAVGGLTWLGRVDFRLDGTNVLVEVQSDRYHASLSSRRDDAARLEALARDGFRVVEVWESDVWHQPDRAVDRIRAAILQ